MIIHEEDTRYIVDIYWNLENKFIKQPKNLLDIVIETLYEGNILPHNNSR